MKESQVNWFFNKNNSFILCSLFEVMHACYVTNVLVNAKGSLAFSLMYLEPLSHES